MSEQNMRDNAGDPDGTWLYRVGGICAILFGVAYIAIIALYVPMGAPPGGAEARLTYMAGNAALWSAIVGLSVLTDFLLVPVALALFLALRRANRYLMLLATACIGLFVVLDLAITWTNYAALLTLSSGYAAAGDAQRAVLVAAAIYPTTVLESNLVFVYNTLTLTLGILLASLVMLRANFSKATAYVGVATGFFGIVAVAGSFFTNALDFSIILASLLTTVWALIAGYRLVRLGRRG